VKVEPSEVRTDSEVIVLGGGVVTTVGGGVGLSVGGVVI